MSKLKTKKRMATLILLACIGTAIIWFTSHPAQVEYQVASEIPRAGKITLQNGATLQITLALTEAEKTKGLSGTQAADFSDQQGMLFFYTAPGPRRYWMPDTYFDLDIFFLDQDLKVLDVERDFPHHIGWQEPPQIASTRTIVATHILEIKATSPHAKAIQIGDTLQWTEGPNLQDVKRFFSEPY